MDATVALDGFYSNNERVIDDRTEMAQDRFPNITTSVSGIGQEDWTMFKKAAKIRGMTYREAMEHAVSDLIADIRSNRDIVWQPTRSAPSKPIKIHDDTRQDVCRLVDRVGYRQNVIFLTAMRRWCDGKTWSRKDISSDQSE